MWCGCGHTIAYEPVDDINCDMSCSGNANEMCGGDVYATVFVLE